MVNLQFLSYDYCVPDMFVFLRMTRFSRKELIFSFLAICLISCEPSGGLGNKRFLMHMSYTYVKKINVTVLLHAKEIIVCKRDV